MNLFKQRIPYKPFEYPEYYTDGWLKQAQAFWLHTEIPMQSDVKDWNEKLTKSEKNLVGNILLGFQIIGHKKLWDGFLNTRYSKWL